MNRGNNAPSKIIWCDMTKCGRISQQFLNTMADFIKPPKIINVIASRCH
jgi:hypothetical protein